MRPSSESSGACEVDPQRHIPIKLGISCSVHLPHAAFADLGGDGVRVVGGAGFETPWLVDGNQALQLLMPIKDHDDLRPHLTAAHHQEMLPVQRHVVIWILQFDGIQVVAFVKQHPSSPWLKGPFCRADWK